MNSAFTALGIRFDAGLGSLLAMLFTDSPSIRDVVLFPLLKPEQGEGA